MATGTSAALQCGEAVNMAVNSTQRRNGLGAAAGRAGGLAGQLFDWLLAAGLVWMLVWLLFYSLTGVKTARRWAEVTLPNALQKYE